MALAQRCLHAVCLEVEPDFWKGSRQRNRHLSLHSRTVGSLANQPSAGTEMQYKTRTQNEALQYGEQNKDLRILVYKLT